MTTPDQAHKLAAEIQLDIMNLPCDYRLSEHAYPFGHRDARHAAAEAVLPLAAACRDMAGEVERLQRNLSLMTDLRNAAEDASNRHANTLGEIAAALGCGPTFLPSELVERVRAVAGERDAALESIATWERFHERNPSAEVERLRGVEDLARDFLFWFNADGSPCDGFRFQEQRKLLADAVEFEKWWQEKFQPDAETERLIHGDNAAK